MEIIEASGGNMFTCGRNLFITLHSQHYHAHQKMLDTAALICFNTNIIFFFFQVDPQDD